MDRVCAKHPTEGRQSSGKCKGCARESHARWRANQVGNEAYAEQRRIYTNRHTAKLRTSVMDLIGRRCVCCGIDRLVFLSLDHIHDDGAAHRKQFANQQSLYRSILADPDAKSKYQTLCHNCNMAKAIEESHSCPLYIAPTP